MILRIWYVHNGVKSPFGVAFEYAYNPKKELSIELLYRKFGFLFLPIHDKNVNMPSILLNFTM